MKPSAQEGGIPRVVLDPGAVPVVLASDEAFAPKLGVCLESMAENADRNRRYEVVILHSGFSPGVMDRIRLQMRRFPNFKVHFVDPAPLLRDVRLRKYKHNAISLETYYRFLIADILPESPKVLYLDSDLVVLGDLADLFAFDLGGRTVGAARDPEIVGDMSSPGSNFLRYATGFLGMRNPLGYFQAGVLVLDLERMRAAFPAARLVEAASAKVYRYNDQDILNQFCEGDVAYLPLAWNCLTDCGGVRTPIIARAPEAVRAEYEAARRSPLIVHYAGKVKPWNERGSDYAHLFWDYAKRSAFYDVLLAPPPVRKKRSLVGILLPRGSRRRALALRLYFRARWGGRRAR